MLKITLRLLSSSNTTTNPKVLLPSNKLVCNMPDDEAFRVPEFLSGAWNAELVGLSGVLRPPNRLANRHPFQSQRAHHV